MERNPHTSTLWGPVQNAQSADRAAHRHCPRKDVVGHPHTTCARPLVCRRSAGVMPPWAASPIATCGIYHGGSLKKMVFARTAPRAYAVFPRTRCSDYGLQLTYLMLRKSVPRSSGELALSPEKARLLGSYRGSAMLDGEAKVVVQ